MITLEHLSGIKSPKETNDVSILTAFFNVLLG